MTHSYTDLTHTTATRNANLQAIYGFRCNCTRCSPTDTAGIGVASASASDHLAGEPDVSVGSIAGNSISPTASINSSSGALVMDSKLTSQASINLISSLDSMICHPLQIKSLLLHHSSVLTSCVIDALTTTITSSNERYEVCGCGYCDIYLLRYSIISMFLISRVVVYIFKHQQVLFVFFIILYIYA